MGKKFNLYWETGLTRNHLDHRVTNHALTELIALLQHHAHRTRFAFFGGTLHHGVHQFRVERLPLRVDLFNAHLGQRVARLAKHHFHAALKGVFLFARRGQRPFEVIHNRKQLADGLAPSVVESLRADAFGAAAVVGELGLLTLMREGMIARVDGRLCLTARGMQVMNAVLVEMMEEEG